MQKYSFSKLASFLQCPRKFYWIYEKGLLPPKNPEALEKGGWFAEGIAGLPGDTLWHKIGRKAGSFWTHNPAAYEVEGEKQATPNLLLTGKCDGIDGDTVWEYKFTSSDRNSTIKSYMISPQLQQYGFVFGAKRVILRIIKKSQLRQGKKESEFDFEARVLAEYDSPDCYFEVEVPITRPSYENFLRDILTTISFINACKDSDSWPMVAPNCTFYHQACPYLDLCADYETYCQIYRRKEDAIANGSQQPQPKA
jgi:hypothetical protein